VPGRRTRPKATATATTPPKRLEGRLNTPEAVPTSRGGYCTNPASGIGGIAMEMPDPAITSRTLSRLDWRVTRPERHQASPAACMRARASSVAEPQIVGEGAANVR